MAFALPVTAPNNGQSGVGGPTLSTVESCRVVRPEQRAREDRKRRQRKTERKTGLRWALEAFSVICKAYL